MNGLKYVLMVTLLITLCGSPGPSYVAAAPTDRSRATAALALGPQSHAQPCDEKDRVDPVIILSPYTAILESQAEIEVTLTYVVVKGPTDRETAIFVWYTTADHERVGGPIMWLPVPEGVSEGVFGEKKTRKITLNPPEGLTSLVAVWSEEWDHAVYEDLYSCGYHMTATAFVERSLTRGWNTFVIRPSPKNVSIHWKYEPCETSVNALCVKDSTDPEFVTMVGSASLEAVVSASFLLPNGKKCRVAEEYAVLPP